MIFEPRLEGHHLNWLYYISSDFLTAGFSITIATDGRPGSRERISERLTTIREKVSLISAFEEAGKLRGGSMTGALSDCFIESGADEVFLNNLDEIASGSLRRAALGIFPPKTLLGRLSGVYFRPRFLASSSWHPGNALKASGFQKMSRDKWFRHIYLMDEHLLERAQTTYSEPSFHFLPDPWDGEFTYNQNAARKILNIPDGAFVLLHYGIADRRKGLHLIVRAMHELPGDSRVYLLCAGKMSHDRRLLHDVATLQEAGRAKILDRYISSDEESVCFCASDVIMLPYIRHFGSSGVLSMAAAAGKMVIASDSDLVGRRVREHELGWLFPSGNVKILREKIHDASLLNISDMNRFRNAALWYASLCSRTAFREALIAPFRHG